MLSRPDERRIWFRIGINLGDDIADSGDIFGDGVKRRCATDVLQRGDEGMPPEEPYSLIAVQLDFANGDYSAAASAWLQPTSFCACPGTPLRGLAQPGRAGNTYFPQGSTILSYPECFRQRATSD
jgi:hypothetical protein